MLKTIKTLAAVSALALMSACGGGGGGAAAPVASTDSFPLMTVYTNSLTTSSSNNYTISGTVSGVAVTGSGTVTFGNLSAGTFEGVAAQQRTTTATGFIVVNGTTDWVDSNYVPKGASGGTDYKVVTGTPTIPTAARVNDTGTLYTANRYSNSTKSVLRGTETVTYVLEADTATTALLKVIITEKDNANTTKSTSSAQYRITPAGAFTRIRETLVEGTTNLTITY